MPGNKKFGSAGKAANQYDNFMRRYEGAYEGTTPPDKEIRTEAFNRAVEASSLNDEGKVHNVLKECVFHYISADNTRDKKKNLTFGRVLTYAASNGLLAEAEPEQILTNIIGQLDQAIGRTAERSAIDESKARNLIKMGRKLCNAASLEGPNVEFIQELEEVIQRHTQQPQQKSADTPSTAPRREQMGRTIKVRTIKVR